MESELFNDCLTAWKNAESNKSYWKDLGQKWGIEPEILRNRFKRFRKKMGITKEDYNKPVPTEVKQIKNNADILFLDIEISPINCLTWSLWPDKINSDAILQDWHIICWSAKHLFDSEILSDCITSQEATRHDDARVSRSIWQLLEHANIVVSHNGNNFDIKRLNTRFLYNGLNPPLPYQSIDTLAVAKNVFDFSSRSLDYINKYLGLPVKEHTDFELWKKCFYGDADALHTMELYNRNDCEILEDTYLKMRPYIKGHPNLNLWSVDNVSVCPNCASEKLDWNVKEYFTFTGKYKGFRCLDCGATGRSRYLDVDKEKRKFIVR